MGSAPAGSQLTLVQLQQEADTIIATVGGFDLEYSGERFGTDGYRYATMLVRTGGRHGNRAAGHHHAARASDPKGDTGFREKSNAKTKG